MQNLSVKEEEIMPDLSSDQKSYYYIREETMREVMQTLNWALNSLGWFLDYAGSKDHVDRWHEAYDPEGAIKALHSAIVKLKEASKATPDFSIDTLKRIILKQDFLLDKIMSVCIHAGHVNGFSEYALRALLKDIFNMWGEIWTEHEPLCNIIHELEYEYRAKINKEKWQLQRLRQILEGGVNNVVD